MRRDGPFRTPAPLTAIESARRVAALKANQESNRPLAAVTSPEMLDEVVAVNEAAATEGNDEFLFGRRTAQLLSDCRRDVALAPADKKIAFEEAARKLAEAVSGQWLPKTVMMDRLLDIAETHGSFGLNPDQLQQLIADAAEAIRLPETASALAPPVRRLITDRAVRCVLDWGHQNGMVRPCSSPASDGSLQGAPKTRSTPCPRQRIAQSR